MIHFVFILSIALQFIAFLAVLRMLVQTKARWTPVFFAVVVLLMGVRRVISYIGVLNVETVPANVSAAEWTALVISACLLSAIVSSGRKMVNLKETLGTVARHSSMLNALEGTAAIGSWWYEPQSGTMRWSEELYRIIGEDKRRVQPSYQFFSRLVHPEDKEKVETAMRRLEGDEREIHISHRIVRRDGTIRTVQVHVQVFQVDRDRTEWFGLMRDVSELQTVRGDLARSEARYRALYEAAPVSIWLEDFSEVGRWLEGLREQGVSDIETYLRDHPEAVRQAVQMVRIKDVNQYTLDLYEADSKEELLSSLGDVFTEESFDFFQMELVALFEGKRTLRFECGQQTLTGRRLTVILEWVVPEVAGGRDLSNTIVTVVDITDRKQAEMGVKTALSRLKEAQEIAHLGNWDWDIPTGRLFWSDEVYRIFGHAPSAFEPSYERFLDCIHPDDRLPVEQAVDLAIREDVPYRVQHRVIRTDGSVVFVEERGRVLRNETGEAVRMAGTVLDVTARVEAGQKLRESEKKYRFLMESLPERVLMKDVHGVYLSVNRTLAGDLGLSAGEMIGRTDFDLVDRDLAEKYASEDQQVIRTGDRLEVDHPFKAADGTKKILHTTKYPILNKAGDIVGIQGIASDVTELRQVEQERDQRMVQLSTLNRILLSVVVTKSVNETAAAFLNEVQLYLGNVLLLVFLRDGGVLSLAHAIGGGGLFRDEVDAQAHTVGECLCGLAVSKGEPVYSVNINGDSRCTLNECKLAGVKSAASIPLLSEGKVIGVFYAGAFNHRDFSKEREFLEPAAGELSMALHNSMLLEKIQSQTEELETLVAERTQNLELKINEIERMNRLFVGRELKMAELKERIAALEQEIDDLKRADKGMADE